MDIFNKLIGWRVPTTIATTVSYDLEELGYEPEQIHNLREIAEIGEYYNLDWKDDIKEILEQLKVFIPSAIAFVAAGVIGYLLPGKLKMIAIAPAGIGAWMFYKKAEEIGWI